MGFKPGGSPWFSLHKQMACYFKSENAMGSIIGLREISHSVSMLKGSLKTVFDDCQSEHVFVVGWGISLPL